MARSRGGAVALLAALALAPASGCSGDADTPDSGDDVDRTTALLSTADLRDGLAALYAGTGPTEAGERTADCFARALLERAEPEALADAGLVVDGAVVDEAPALPEATARDWYAAQDACTDYVTVSARAQRAATKGKIDEAAYATCLRAALTDAQIEDAVVATLTGSWEDPAVGRLGTAQSDCASGALPGR